MELGIDRLFSAVVRTTMKRLIITFCAVLGGLELGCGLGVEPANPFRTLAEMSVTGSGQQQSGSAGSQSTPPAVFRASMDVVLNNHHTEADLNTSFLAWVDPGSVRTADQQEELLNSNYIRGPAGLVRQRRIRLHRAR
jgi:hypothetical protein